MSAAIVDVTGRVARLYQESPRTFVAQRNTLARDLARAGQRELSTRIKALAKPSISAWVVNQLHWHDRREYEALLASGTAAREAQQARLSGRGGDLIRALAERDAIVDRLARQAERLAAAGGVALTQDLRSRVRTSLEALALRAGDASIVHGQLTDDVALPGLQALAGLIGADQAVPPPAPPKPALALVPAPARDDHYRAKVAALGRELDEVRAALEQARTDATVAQDLADDEAGAATAAEQQVTAAARALDAAQQRLVQTQGLAYAAAARAEAAVQEAERVAASRDTLSARVRELTAEIAELAAGPPPRPPAAKTRRVSRKR